MKERPILFNAPMVRAILAGEKTQTRRLVKPQPPEECSIHYMLGDESWLPEESRKPLHHFWEAWGGPLFQQRPKGHLCGSHTVRSPYGKPGDRLWVREAFGEEYDWCDHPEMPGCPKEWWHIGWHYRADGEVDRSELEGAFNGWKPSIHMPRRASRILLEVVSVRVECLQEISEADAQAEGCSLECMTPTGDDSGSAIYGPGGYIALWESINGSDSWTANPWVWVVEFRRVQQ